MKSIFKYWIYVIPLLLFVILMLVSFVLDISTRNETGYVVTAVLFFGPMLFIDETFNLGMFRLKNMTSQSEMIYLVGSSFFWIGLSCLLGLIIKKVKNK